MKYYEGHETAYLRLKSEGHDNWDKRPFEQFYMRPFLERVVRMYPAKDGESAIEFGCGTGPISCFLAGAGYDVSGIDVSATAIEMARTQASARGFSKIKFKVGDWLALSGEPLVDLIVDGHCLHCIVFDEERMAALRAARALLKPGGRFALETMCFHPRMKFAPNFHYDQDGVLWVRVPQTYSSSLKKIGDDWYVPNRRIIQAERIEEQLLAAGFRIAWKAVVQNEGTTDPDEFQAICEL
jgi:SAM-dependent methyltransferase